MPPHGIDLVAYATISADMAEGDRAFTEVLEGHGLTADQWTEVLGYWSAQMTSDAREAVLAGTEARLVLEFSEAFAIAQDRKRPLPALDVAGWVALRREVDRLGPQKALADRGLGLADYSRLIRYWAKALATDRELAATFDRLDENV